MIRAAVLSILTLTISLVSADSLYAENDSALVGHWVNTENASGSLRLNADGSYSMTRTRMGRQIVLTGTWRTQSGQSPKWLTLTFQRLTIDGEASSRGPNPGDRFNGIYRVNSNGTLTLHMAREANASRPGSFSGNNVQTLRRS